MLLTFVDHSLAQNQSHFLGQPAVDWQGLLTEPEYVPPSYSAEPVQWTEFSVIENMLSMPADIDWVSLLIRNSFKLRS